MDNNELVRLIIKLIRAHYEELDKDDFESVCREVARSLDDDGQYQLASYVRVLCGDGGDVFIPM